MRISIFARHSLNRMQMYTTRLLFEYLNLEPTQMCNFNIGSTFYDAKV